MRRNTPPAGELSWPTTELTISASQVARLANTGPRDRWDDAIAAAIEAARSLAQPSGRWARLDADRHPDGLFPDPTPVSAIVEGGDECWLFAVTIGPALETRVEELFAANELLDAVLLDAAGSITAEATCDLLQRALCGDAESERYSPGYCAWDMLGQRAIFDRVQPERLGVELLDTMLMQPLKSVTGVIVRAARETLRVEPAVCAGCDARGCTRRRAKYTGGS
jgi:hypothetical protein